ncbi:fructokinase [Stigmatella aurantiaca]|uniref:Fructokinase n=1 Tax=Stigmatella aurantiaca TaxID=41 RepID=A0A1H7FFX7_STIAU|nr:carbohydrate kinase [Stigmatella aurantiaca]SEK24986.1 fructokinase [Stigmatella aurantiaca]
MIISCGEALIDLIPSPEDGNLFRAVPGGSPFNTALALARLGAPTAFLGRISQDAFGNQLAQVLEDNGVNLRLTVRGPELTTLAFVKKVEGQASYAFYTQGTADRLLQPGDLPKLPDGAILHWGLGAVVLDGAPVAHTLEALFRQEKDRRLLSFDPNIRPPVIGAAHLPAYAKRVTEALSAFHLVKVSDEDLAALFPGARLDDIAQRWLERGPSLVVVTRGGEGASVFRQSGTRLDVPAAKLAKFGDTVGAGDSFTAGLLTQLYERGVRRGAELAALDDATLKGCATFAARVAAKTCEHEGCNPPRRSELGE